MFKTVLVPLDGSPLAESAIDPALAIVRRCDAGLHVATVRTSLPLPGGGDDAEALYLEQMAAVLGIRIGRPVTPVMLVDVIAGRPLGDPPRRAVADVLADYVREAPIDLTVMTSHGRGGLLRAYMGSVADTFMRYSPSPVLIVNPQKRAAIKRILVLLDGSAEAEMIIQPAIDLASALSAECTLLRIIGSSCDPHDAARQLTQLCKAFQRAGIVARAEVRMSDNVATEIIVYAVTRDVDVVALTTRTRNPLQRMILGSVAETLVRKSGKPVLICNPFAQTAGIPTPVAAEVAHAR